MVQTMSTIQDFEQENISLQEDIKKQEAFARLIQNEDFNLLIGEGYLINEAIRLVHARPGLFGSRVEAVQGVDRKISAIGEFREFLMDIKRKGESAREKLVENYESIRELSGQGE